MAQHSSEDPLNSIPADHHPIASQTCTNGCLHLVCSVLTHSLRHPPPIVFIYGSEPRTEEQPLVLVIGAGLVEVDYITD